MTPRNLVPDGTFRYHVCMTTTGLNYTYRVYAESGVIVLMTLCTDHAYTRRHDLDRKRNGDAKCRPVRKVCADCERGR